YRACASPVCRLRRSASRFRTMRLWREYPTRRRVSYDSWICARERPLQRIVPMILTADSIAAQQANRRRTGNGWHTTYIGKNRNTLKEGEAPPADDVIYPMAFLVEKDAAAVVKPHFHSADQYQIVVQGGGRLGIHDIGSIAVHYTDAYSASGPIIAADEGVSWFTLRNTWDPGARYMPAARQQLREARARYQHREATCGPLPPLSEAELAALTGVTGTEVIETTKDGLGTWRYTVPALGS